MKKVVKIKWENLLVLLIFLASTSLIIHDFYIISIGNLFNTYTQSLTVYGTIINAIAIFISSLALDILGGI